jgi:hypothetical protein
MLLVAFSRRMCCSRAWKLALERVGDADVTGVRAAVAHRNAEPLRAADRHVGAELAGRGQQGEREQVRGHDSQRSSSLRGSDGWREVAQLAASAGVLEQHSEQLPAGLRFDQLGRDPADDQLDA